MHKAVIYAILGLLFLTLNLPGRLEAYPKYTPRWSLVEKKFIDASGRQEVYPNEYIPLVETSTQYELGKLTALRFIEWVKDHPKGVIALTSGATPEYFIKFLNYYKKNWHKANVQQELRGYGINLKNFPDTSNLRFVQIEEYYPMSPKHHQKVSNYINRHYVKLLKLKKENVLLMDVSKTGIIAEKGLKVVFMSGKIDLSIMKHKPNSQLENWQQQAIKDLQVFCDNYEKKIRDWGGIDFFLGSISYAGHLGFINAVNSANSKTHILNLDYNTAAHAAKDLGGIEHARGKIGITIGLDTITSKSNAQLIIIANGEVKAKVIKDAVQSKYSTKHPTSVLQNYPNTRVYLSSSAASLLSDRKLEELKISTKRGWTRKRIEEVIVEIALAENKAILDLTKQELGKYENGRQLLQNPPKPLAAMLQDVREDLINKIDAGLKLYNYKITKVLHTAPHHDDIMLAYYPLIDSFNRAYKNNYVYFTSGYNSVPDSYIMSAIHRASDWWINKHEVDIFNKPYPKIIARFRSYYIDNDVEQMNMLETTILLKHIVAAYNLKNLDQLKAKIRWFKDEYFPSKQHGDMDDTLEMKLIKGMMRESEVDRLWSVKNFPLQDIRHMRAKFYFGKEFSKTPRIESDVRDFLNIYNEYKPDLITLADDPQSAPPVTHYKILQIVAQALRSSNAVDNKNLNVLGYRHIWFRYKIPEANIYVPVTKRMLEEQKRAFLSCFNTQNMAAFPSPFYEGNFSVITTMIQRQQLHELKMLLGEDYFNNSKNAELRNANGMIFFNRMNLETFFQHAEDLQKAIDLEVDYENS